MNFIKNIIYTLCLLLIINQADAKLSSFEGLHFYVGFMQNEVTRVNSQIPVDQKIFISSQKDANIDIRLPYEGSNLKFLLRKGEIYTLDVNSIYETNISEIINYNRLVYITSNVPITVYAFSTQEKTSDSYSVIPVSYWGNNYTVVTVPNDTYSDPTETMYNTPRQGEFLIMAAEDNTEVFINPSYETEKGKPANTEFKITLNKGYSYLVQSEPVPLGQGDLTGTKIRSTKPIGLLSGHVRASIPVGIERNLDSKDHLIEMLMPEKAWGKQFVSIPFGVNSMGDYFKVVSKTPNTKVSLTTSSGTVDKNTENATSSVVFDKINEPAVWTSNEPLQLAQFMMRTEVIEDINFADYDPSMVMVVPTEQFISYVNFHTPGNTSTNNPNQYKKHFVLIVAEKEALSSLYLDEDLLINTSEISENQILNTNYHWIKVQLSKGVHSLSSSTGRFSGILFGVGRYDSYAFVLGAALNKPGTNDVSPPDLVYNVDCFTISGKIFEEISDNNYGISHYEIKTDSTYNYSFNFSEILPNSTEIDFNCTINNPFEDAKIAFNYYDKNGNFQSFSYFHEAVNLDIVSNFDFGIVDWQDSVCFDITITNNGNSTQKIENIIFSGDNRLSIHNDNIPITLTPGETTVLKLCVDPKNVDGLVDGLINVDIGCNLNYETRISGSVIGTGLLVEGYDFGNVRLGESSCSNIKITNNGKVSIEILSIDDSLLGNEFTIDQSKLPVVLDVDDFIELPACFYPQFRGLTEKTFSVSNQFSIYKTGILKGNGLAPEINSVTHDFGNKRVGTQNAYTVFLDNTGDADIRITFDYFEINTIVDDNITQTLQNINNELIRAGESIGIPLEFNPQNTDFYDVIAVFSTDWEQINNLKVEVKGQGTLPSLELQNVNFGNRFIYSESEINQEIIYSSGNEQLAVKSAFIIEGDEQSFVIDLNQFQNLIIDENSSYYSNVIFKPTRLGYHELKIGIIHDANPNYEESIDTLLIIGNATIDDNIGINIIHQNEEMIKCDFKKLELIFTNNMNLPVDISEVNILQINENNIINTISDLNNLLPLSLSSSESFTVEYEILSMSNTIELVFEVVFFDEVKIQYPIELIVNILDNEISDIAAKTIDIGETIDLSLSGKFPESTNGVLIKPNLKINLKMQNLWLESEEFILNLTDGEGRNELLEMELINTNLDFLEFQSIEEIELQNETNWNLDLKFLSLLSKDKEAEISAIISSNTCFFSDSTNILIKYNEICNFDLRNVKLIANLPFVNIAPSPIHEKIKFTFELSEESEIKITIMDQIGKELTLINDLRLSPGVHEIEYPLDQLSSGVYFANVTIGKKIFNKLIIISK